MSHLGNCWEHVFLILTPCLIILIPLGIARAWNTTVKSSTRGIDGSAFEVPWVTCGRPDFFNLISTLIRSSAMPASPTHTTTSSTTTTSGISRASGTSTRPAPLARPARPAQPATRAQKEKSSGGWPFQGKKPIPRCFCLLA